MNTNANKRSENYQFEKDCDAIRWLSAEILLRAFNDILSKRWYQYHLIRYLKNHNKRSKLLLLRHQEAVDWFVKERDNVFFRVLKIDQLTDKTIIKTISDKFNNPKKFNRLNRVQFSGRRCDTK